MLTCIEAWSEAWTATTSYCKTIGLQELATCYARLRLKPHVIPMIVRVSAGVTLAVARGGCTTCMLQELG